MKPTLENRNRQEQPETWAEPFDLLLHLSRYSRKPVLIQGVRPSEHAVILQSLKQRLHHTEWCVAKTPLKEAQDLLSLLQQRWPLSQALESRVPMEVLSAHLQALRYDRNNHVIVVDASLLSQTVWHLLLELMKTETDLVIHNRLLIFATPDFLKQSDSKNSYCCTVNFDHIVLSERPTVKCSVSAPPTPLPSVAAELPVASVPFIKKITGKSAQLLLTVVVMTFLFAYWIQPKSHPETALPHTVIEFAPPAQDLVSQKPSALSSEGKTQAKLKQPVQTKKAVNTLLVQQQQKLLKMPAHHYVLQLMVVRHPEKLLKTLNASAVGAVRYYQTTYQNKMRYVVVYGEYDSAEKAKAAIDTLPKSLQAYHPWPRRIGSIHRSLRA